MSTENLWSVIKNMDETIRIFIGTEEKTEIARKVLQSSILRRTTHSVAFVPMIGPQWEYNTSKIKQGTGFSLRRWMIPEFCNWQGHAIYLDADQIVLGQIASLWSFPVTDPKEGRAAWMTYQPSKFSRTPHPNSSVMVIDCAAAKNYKYFHLDLTLQFLKDFPEKEHYASLMYPEWLHPGKLPVTWNRLNEYVEGDTSLLHYTKEPEQPFYKPDHPLAYLWKEELVYAIENGHIERAEFELALSKWGVKEDWRNTNGLHPKYAKYLRYFKG